jgi:hypothetical protein
MMRELTSKELDAVCGGAMDLSFLSRNVLQNNQAVATSGANPQLGLINVHAPTNVALNIPTVTIA